MKSSIITSAVKSNKQISIVIVTFNSSISLPKLIKSIEKSNEYVSKIIVIENSSPDKIITRRVLKGLINKYRTLKIEYHENKINEGFAYACNQGANMAYSKYILFLNPDTILKRNSLKILLEHTVQGNYDIAGGQCKKIGSGIHSTAVRHPDLKIGLLEFTNVGKILHINEGNNRFYYKDKDIENSKIDTPVEAVSGAFLLIKKISFRKLHGFDERFFMYLEDVDLGHRAKILGMRVYYCPHSKIFHEGGASSKNKYRIVHKAWFQSRKYYYMKHHSVFVNLIIQPIFIVEELFLASRMRILALIK